MITKQQEADLKKYLKAIPEIDRCMVYARGLKTTARLWFLPIAGWTGKLWPDEDGWPIGYPEEPGLRQMISRVPILNTFSFQPHPERGNSVLKILALKSNGVFPVPLQISPEDRVQPTDEQRATFERLKEDPSIFMPGSWMPGIRRKIADSFFPSSSAIPTFRRIA